MRTVLARSEGLMFERHGRYALAGRQPALRQRPPADRHLLLRIKDTRTSYLPIAAHDGHVWFAMLVTPLSGSK